MYVYISPSPSQSQSLHTATGRTQGGLQAADPRGRPAQTTKTSTLVALSGRPAQKSGRPAPLYEFEFDETVCLCFLSHTHTPVHRGW